MAYVRDVMNNTDILDSIKDDDIRKRSKLLIKVCNLSKEGFDVRDY